MSNKPILHILSMYFAHKEFLILTSNILLRLSKSVLYAYRCLMHRLSLCSASGAWLLHIDNILCPTYREFLVLVSDMAYTLISVAWHDSEPYISMQNNCKWTAVSRATSSLISVTVSRFMCHLQLGVYCLVAICVYWTFENSTHCTKPWVVSLSPSDQLSLHFSL
jgi:hypothetical protein